MPWLTLFVAGLLEIVWAVGLKYSHGFTRPVASAVTLGALIASLALLGTATRSLPIGTAYAVWVGIGAVGTALAGIVLLGDDASLARLGWLAALVVSIIGLKMTA
jgi:quaternary ammonium compound-resistance protein SugE